MLHKELIVQANINVCTRLCSILCYSGVCLPFLCTGLDHEVCQQKMRVLTVISLAGESQEVPFSRLCSELCLSVEELDQFVIDSQSTNYSRGREGGREVDMCRWYLYYVVSVENLKLKIVKHIPGMYVRLMYVCIYVCMYRYKQNSVWRVQGNQQIMQTNR